MTRTGKVILVIVVMLLATAGVWVALANYFECRTTFSMFYCVTTIFFK